MAKRSDPWTDDDDSQLLDMLAKGKSWLAISLRLKRTVPAVRGRRKKLFR